MTEVNPQNVNFWSCNKLRFHFKSLWQGLRQDAQAQLQAIHVTCFQMYYLIQNNDRLTIG